MNKQDFQIRARLRHALKAAGLRDHAKLVVGVSGGCDSVSLLHLLHAEAASRKWSLTIGHIDHNLRPDSRGDAVWVRELGARLGIPSHGLRIRDGFWEEQRGKSIEDVARRARRAGLERIRRRIGAESILLGHTLDDQAETVLLQLLRGTGLRGMTGMRPKTGSILRPMLAVRRKEIRELAVRRGWSWREDISNEDPRFLRNRIRKELLPYLEQEFSGGIAPVLARTASVLTPVRAFLEDSVDRAWVEIEPAVGRRSIHLDRSKLASYHQPLIEGVLRRAFSLLRGSARGSPAPT